MAKYLFLLLFLLFSILILAQDTNKVKPIVIYSGEYCVEISKNYIYRYTKCHSQDTSKQKKHFFELVLLDNYEFWVVQNSRNTFQRDSLQFITGTWKIDSQNYVLTVDSISKRFVHFKNSEYRPPYFKKAFFKTPSRAIHLDFEEYSLMLAHVYIHIQHISREIYPPCFCFIILSKTFSFPIKTETLPIQYLDLNIVAEVPRIYTRPVKLIQRP